MHLHTAGAQHGLLPIPGSSRAPLSWDSESPNGKAEWQGSLAWWVLLSHHLRNETEWSADFPRRGCCQPKDCFLKLLSG